MLMRGGTSKGTYFLSEDLPLDRAERDDLIRRLMGSPDPRQIDGIGGAHPLTSKVAIVGKSDLPDVDLDYLFLQVGVETDVVTDAQNCGNLLAGVGPFAVERGLLTTTPGETRARIRMLNTNSLVTARFSTDHRGQPIYDGVMQIAGVPGTAAAIRLDFEDTQGATSGQLLPTASASDTIDGVEITCIDNGMPVIVLRADDVGVTGYETCAELEANDKLRSIIEAIRLKAGPLMNLGDVSALTIPKVTLVAAPRDGGDISTRSFIPHRCHDAIGVLGAVSVATAALLPGSPANSVLAERKTPDLVTVEHPTGTFDVSLELEVSDSLVDVRRSGIVRTARKLFDGTVFPRSYS